ncbi:MAG: hypothetical protein R6V49_03755 [Bacteroidales bacterium]
MSRKGIAEASITFPDEYRMAVKEVHSFSDKGMYIRYVRVTDDRTDADQSCSSCALSLPFRVAAHSDSA